MKKTLFYSLILLILISCKQDEEGFKNSIEANPIYYWKDPMTNLCFMNTGKSVNNSTCVPCDSLKKVRVFIKPITEEEIFFSIEKAQKEMWDSLKVRQ